MSDQPNLPHPPVQTASAPTVPDVSGRKNLKDTMSAVNERTAESRLRVDVAGYDFMAGDIELDPDTLEEGLHYRFVQESPQRIARRKAQGYRVVKRSDGVRLLADEEAGDSEDIIRSGDRILMACPQEVFEERRAKKARLTQARLSQGDRQFRRRSREKGVRVVGEDNED